MGSAQYDLEKICRVCKGEAASMRSLFDDDNQGNGGPRIDEMLMACTAVMVNSDDGLPPLICYTCTDRLHRAYHFKMQCESTDSTLRQYLKDIGKMVKEEPHQASQNEEHLDSSDQTLPDINTVINNLVSGRATVVEANNFPHLKVDPDGANFECTITGDYIEFLENSQLLLTCRTCSKCFTTLDGLKCHKRLHTGSLFKCKECGKQYTRQNHLHRHELTHGRRKIHVCKICNKTLTRFEHLKRHLITHLKEKPFTCEICSRGFNRAEHLANHVRRCKGDRVHICDICNKGFNRQDSLEVHRRLHENKMPILPTLENLDNIDEHYLEIECGDLEDLTQPLSDSDSDGEVADCLEPQVDISEKAEPVKLDEASESNLEFLVSSANMEVVSEEKNEAEEEEAEPKKPVLLRPKEDDEDDDYFDTENGSQFEIKEEQEDTNSTDSEYLPTKPVVKVKRKRGRPRKNNFLKRPRRPPGRPKGRAVKVKIEDNENEPEGEFPCPACDNIFTKLSLLDKHAVQHEGLKIHSCSVCTKKFARANHLKRHMLSHSTQKPFSCEICTKSFNRRDHLMQHMKLHTKDQEYECEICKRPFARADHLAKHKASKHNIGDKVAGEKKYQCTVCMKAFTTEKYRDVHMKGHMGDKEYQCKTCDKMFLSKSHLTEHIKFHNENSKKFLCSECGQRFIRNDYLVIHMRRHRGEKPFKCQYCGKGFPRTTDLTVHERYHTGEKTHLCTICGRGFGRAYNLTVHMRTHTGEKPYQCTYCEAAFAQGNDLKAHVRRHTGERFQCEHCSEGFLMGYLLTQHKRNVHGLNVVSNIRRLQQVIKSRPDEIEDPPITISLPAPVVPTTVFNTQLQAQLAVAHLQQQIARQ